MELANDHALLLIVTGNPIKFVYNGKRKQFKSQTVGQKRISFFFTKINGGAELEFKLWTIGDDGQDRFMSLLNTAPNKTFTIEGIFRNGYDCYKVDSEYLSAHCKGEISVRPNF